MPRPGSPPRRRQAIRNSAGLRAAAIVALIAAASPAAAQSYQCRAPRSVAVPEVERDGPVRTVPVAGYTLALSWSPEFCKGRDGQARHRTQCSGRNGRFGFVVHGLWPEGRNIWPQWCPTARRVAPAEARRNLCVSPSAALLARQWAKHGSCMVRRRASERTRLARGTAALLRQGLPSHKVRQAALRRERRSVGQGMARALIRTETRSFCFTQRSQR